MSDAVVSYIENNGKIIIWGAGDTEYEAMIDALKEMHSDHPGYLRAYALDLKVAKISRLAAYTLTFKGGEHDGYILRDGMIQMESADDDPELRNDVAVESGYF